MFRGTFRYDKWCKVIDVFKELKLFSYDKMDVKNLSYAGFIAKLLGFENAENIKYKVMEKLGVGEDADPIVAMEWTGLFSDENMEREEASPFDITSDLMIPKMMIDPEERDMVVLEHTFVANYPDGNKEVIKSRMLDFGTLKTDTSIARTVALPAACAVDMILKGKIDVKGVYIPVIPEIYNPILDQLETLDIKLVEEYGLPMSENIQ